MSLEALAPDRLLRRTGDAALPFATTAELAPPEEPLGQARALEALELGVSLEGPAHHVFALGPPGVGKRALVSRVLARRAAARPAPDDWCYVNDFADPQRPRALRLPAGRGARLRAEMDRMLDDLRAAIPAVFESEDYRARLQLLGRQLEERRQAAMHAVQAHAAERQLAVVRTPVGLAVAPVRGGEVLDPEEFRKLPAEEREKLQEAIGEAQERLQAALRGMPRLEQAHREQVKALNREVALFAVGHLLDELRGRWSDQPQVLAHLDAVQADVLENVHEFLGAAETEDAAGQLRKLLTESPAVRRYGVNVIVDHAGAAGAPVVVEDHPTWPNLLGRIEHHAHFGALVTDFTLVRPGALHRANGGFLVLEARKLLSEPFAWEQLERALRAGQLRIESPERLYGLSGTSSLEPQPIPLSVKVVLLGEPLLYHLLSALDPEFPQLFQVAAEFEPTLPRAGNELGYARLCAALARGAGLRPLERGAVARAIEQGARAAGDAARLSADVQALLDLLREADQQAARAGRPAVARGDVQAALDARRRRHGRLREQAQEEIARGTLLIDLAGSAVGQVNGLSVVALGPAGFGRPSRITARVRLGRGEVVDVEREVELGGPIHSKGVLILAGYLGGRFAAHRPLTLSASLVFEQSYGGVEGDSASCAELCALLSALSDLPLRQAIAVTGSVNQLGQVQAVGAVNEKVEGFFEVCRARGLDGAQGVVVPAANLEHLMLSEEVVEACAAGRFRVFAARHVDEVMELLTGVPAGERGADGAFPPGSVNARVEGRLAELAREARDFAAPGERRSALR